MFRRRPLYAICHVLKYTTKPTPERIEQLSLPAQLNQVALPPCCKGPNCKAEPYSELPPGSIDVKRLKRYLGLLPLDHRLSAQRSESAENVTKLDPIFVAIDLEAFEWNRNKITEIGVSILDTRDINNIECGIGGADWLAKIRTRHFIIHEHRELVNKKFVKGCPDKFNFGRSEWLSLRHVSNVMQTIFRVADSNHRRGFRNIVLVGHDVASDVGYFKLLGYSPHSSGAILDTLDTQKISSPKGKSWGLRKLCERLGIQSFNLHNAGNDAAYTMQVLVLMALKHAAGELELPIPRPPKPAKILKKEQVPCLQDPITSIVKQESEHTKADLHMEQTVSVAVTVKDDHREASVTASKEHEKHFVQAETSGTTQVLPKDIGTPDNALPIGQLVTAAKTTSEDKKIRRSEPVRRSTRIKKLAARSLQVTISTAPHAKAPE